MSGTGTTTNSIPLPADVTPDRGAADPVDAVTFGGVTRIYCQLLEAEPATDVVEGKVRVEATLDALDEGLLEAEKNEKDEKNDQDEKDEKDDKDDKDEKNEKDGDGVVRNIIRIC